MATSTVTSTSTPTNIYQAIPGLNNLVGTSASNISNLLSGLPSPDYARTLGAYAGATAGQPGGASQLGTFAGNLGLDLYQQQAHQDQQTGLANLSQLIGSTSGNLTMTPGQTASSQLGFAGLGQRGEEFNQQQALQSFMDQINALATLGSFGGGAGGNNGALNYA